jgi:hypothetical protein
LVALGAAALAGSVAAGIAGGRLGPAAGMGLPNLTGRSWRLVGMTRGQLPTPGAQLAVTGELIDQGGRKLGEFYATSVFMGAPHGAGDTAASYAETHHFNLLDGTLLGSGTWHVNGSSRFVILGGTGRYAGATGAYEAVQRPLELGGDGSAAFNFNLIAAGGANGSR